MINLKLPALVSEANFHFRVPRLLRPFWKVYDVWCHTN